MTPLLTAVFAFLNSSAGQKVVASGETALAEAITGLIGLAHKHVATQVAADAASAAK